MITQFDHLTLSVPDFEGHRALLKHFGFTERFAECDSRNPQIKRPFVHHFEEQHDLALFDAPNSLSIELVHQGEYTGVESSMTPIFENVPLAHGVRGSAGMKLIDGSEVSEAKITGLEVPVFTRTERGEGPCVFQSCVVRVPELEASLALWRALGCALVERTATQAILSFGSPFLGFTARFYLIETPIESRLDSYGFNYVAFVATSAALERERFLKLGQSATPLGTETVNGKKLELFFLQEGMKAPIEIFSVLR